MGARDLTGKRGEWIATMRLTDFCGNPIPYFDPHLLDGKFPTYDILVELTGGSGSKPYFLGQIKTTRLGSGRAVKQLKVGLRAMDVRAMICCPIPTYPIGVDEVSEVAYIVSIYGGLMGGNLIHPDQVSARSR